MPQPNEVAVIRISLNNAGQVAIDGPMENKLLFYGLLEVAKETCYEFNKAAEQRVKLAPAGLSVKLPGS